ncbi:peptidase inhibitor family I36 protein [Nonomuraea sp. NPDC050783]|uniref:peptidase inhibitor family I36 protein n=1 Tax=Nonomuraea sp. NPDC050783 TaxID=3154634 RepID=UPI003467A60C
MAVLWADRDLGFDAAMFSHHVRLTPNPRHGCLGFTYLGGASVLPRHGTAALDALGRVPTDFAVSLRLPSGGAAQTPLSDVDKEKPHCCDNFAKSPAYVRLIVLADPVPAHKTHGGFKSRKPSWRRMRMRRIGAMLMLTTALALPAVAPSAAQAETAGRQDLNDCPGGYMCVWTGPNFDGLMYRVLRVQPGDCKAIIPGYRSAYNRTSWPQKLSARSNCTGGIELGPGESYALGSPTRYSIGAWP